MDRDLARCVDSNAYFVAPDVHHGDGDVVADNDAFAAVAAKD